MDAGTEVQRATGFAAIDGWDSHVRIKASSKGSELTMTMNPVVHFEMPAADKERVARFYTEAFGWEMKQLGPEMGDYVLATTTDIGEGGLPTAPGAINGGFFGMEDTTDPYPHVVIGVDEISDSIVKVKAAGGEVLGEPMDIPGVGRYVPFRDSEGNMVGMLQPLPMTP